MCRRDCVDETVNMLSSQLLLVVQQLVVAHGILPSSVCCLAVALPSSMASCCLPWRLAVVHGVLLSFMASCCRPSRLTIIVMSPTIVVKQSTDRPAGMSTDTVSLGKC